MQDENLFIVRQIGWQLHYTMLLHNMNERIATAVWRKCGRQGAAGEVWIQLLFLFCYSFMGLGEQSFIHSFAPWPSQGVTSSAGKQSVSGRGNSAWMVVIVGGGNKKLKRNILLWFHFMCVGMVFAMQMWFSYRINKYEMWLSHNWNLIIIGLKLFCHPPPIPDSQSYL